jgi:cation diffusion facilitator family transporter
MSGANLVSLSATDPVEKKLYRSTLVGVLANALLAAVKSIAGVAGNSYALIADGVESAFDVFSSLIVLGGLKLASTPRDANHPYGHGKAEPLAALVVAIVLLTAAVAIAIESVREIVTPHHAPAPFTLVVLVLVVVTKEALYRFVFRVGEAVRSTAVKTDAWHHRSDAMTSTAAFVGISIALLGGKGYESADDWAALLAAGVICYNAYRLIVPALDEVMDAAPPSDVEHHVRLAAGRVPGVATLDKCFVRKMGLDYYVDLHVVVDGAISVSDGHEIAHKVKDAIRSSNPRIVDVLVHVEPIGGED